MGLENINGRMAENIRANINLIKSMVSDNIHGQMAVSTMGNGQIVSGMGRGK